MYGYIYKTTNLINGKIYIGQHKAQTFDPYYFGSGYILKEAFKKYKPKRINFKCEVLEWCEKNTISEREKYWISFYDTKNPAIGYNISDGGQGRYLGAAKRGLTGKVKITNEIETKFINTEDLENFLSIGWTLVDKNEARRRAHQKWKKENKAKVREHKKAWKKRHPENRYHKKHKNDPEYQEKIRQQNAKYYEEHKEALKEYYRNYQKNRRLANKAK